MASTSKGSMGKKMAEIGDYETRIADAMAELHRKIHSSHSKKLKVDDGLRAVDGYMDKFRSENRFGNQQRSKLKSLSSTALRDCQIEAESLRKCLSDIAYIRKLRLEKRMHARSGSGGNQHEHRSPGAAPTIRRGALMVLLQQSANTLPLFIPKIGEQPPPLCGAMPQLPAYICESGSAVAALVKGDDENWILAEVISYNSQTNKYEVEDVDEEQKLRYQLPKRKVIALPQYRANPITDIDSLFPQDAVVLALYPQTTCFYKGVVEQVPATATDDYLVAFEDGSYPSGYSPPLPVPQRYVVAYRDVKK